MQNVLELKGEGMMIKDPDCSYERKRSDNLLKVKTF
jgi:ATP-dependent DNA ligase